MVEFDALKNRVVVITGPTATGKTLLGVRLSKELDGEVVSADSMQIYKNMNIGTAKPTVIEMNGIKHHMIDVVSPHEDYSVARYVKEASCCIDDILRLGKMPVIVGGSGLYVDSLIRGRVFMSRGDTALRGELEIEYEARGGEAMLKKLSTLDASSAEKLNVNDKKRIVRALEVVITTGEPLSKHDENEKKLPDKYIANKFALNFCDRAVLYDKINKRVDAMIEAGLVDEVKSLLNDGVPLCSTAMKAIGYKEIAEALIGNTDMDAAVNAVKTQSTRYAKRQLTWLRRDENINWITWDDKPDIDLAVDIITGSLK